MERATSLQREAARLDGIGGQLASQIAETRSKVNEAQLQSLQAEQTFVLKSCAISMRRSLKRGS